MWYRWFWRSDCVVDTQLTGNYQEHKREVLGNHPKGTIAITSLKTRHSCPMRKYCPGKIVEITRYADGSRIETDERARFLCDRCGMLFMGSSARTVSHNAKLTTSQLAMWMNNHRHLVKASQENRLRSRVWRWLTRRKNWKDATVVGQPLTADHYLKETEADATAKAIVTSGERKIDYIGWHDTYCKAPKSGPYQRLLPQLQTSSNSASYWSMRLLQQFKRCGG